FFFQAEDGIRDFHVTGVQTCALPIYDQTSYKAVAGLYENLEKTDDWRRWVTERSANESIKPQYRADAFVALAAKQNTCANEISEIGRASCRERGHISRGHIL